MPKHVWLGKDTHCSCTLCAEWRSVIVCACCKSVWLANRLAWICWHFIRYALVRQGAAHLSLDCWPAVTGQQSQASSHRPAVTGQQSQASSHRPAVTGQQSQASSHRPAVTGQQSQASSHRPAVSGQQSQASSLRRCACIPANLFIVILCA
jgi:hypothetical protein